MSRLKRLRELETAVRAGSKSALITDDMTPAQAARAYSEFVSGTRHQHREDVSPADAKALADAYAATLDQLNFLEQKRNSAPAASGSAMCAGDNSEVSR